ncbi:MAG: prepilin-type N-terminal cleavage/methylation domain-containing protein [Gallionellales bacterium RIFCSPLOWO2_12_FULL_59_22]|nr:MAG: prepilin-type N-terminal cleavage/methylation domain-containing protein [Gallionellales bacterium RIFCSPLOWO2_02_FULL_59_110]OGT04940.1 MAG: prepilin-type N-terminal cleavage/methylation domain-containing protein [Gallionellales bacterium RIFCSPLOWO2_02_58_13]OGT13923.1 MAG: prepilin-type N-terminal cleavage/methylation domain-containing protein [Gallionellales bacterium RIFCSPLOWO2_12_FULL_59_22]
MLTRKNLSGFTLVEMAMVLLIIGLLLGGLIPTLSSQMEAQRVNETRKQLDEIQQALIGFSVINGRLPCPANPTIATGQAGAGTERAPPCTSSNSTGVLPWATLGVDETDAWGNRYTYRVTAIFADAVSANSFGGSCTPSPAPTLSSFALCSSGNLDVRSAASGGTSVAIDAPAVVISHGKNAAGAYTQLGAQLPASGDSDEQENSDGSTDNNYVSHTPTSSFDDQVVWLSGNILLNRMVMAGKLP